MRIGQLSNALGVTTDTLRYYETHGLLTPSSRNDAGYRLYDETHLKQMHFILRAKEVGFSLREIQELLQIKIEKQQRRCEEVKAITLQKRDLVRQKISDLQCFEQSLTILANRCCGGKESADYCSILTALEDIDVTYK
ncbi:Zn(2+)-responsive transcriptional regulator [Pseudoalteromonas aurantia]|uniref:MerR family transcriptional regulator, Zn(II)-responsive regulator of zntA n=1 Tax=Pseudoalteromonas aurantia 208 TaxID=1314867 RepID=A0ABR9E878_9GAMM|nr:Zn(2+)-responsive transcriptional regulator [Pseudoalteromonas aurantia]MBE0367161.1 MerR family transcriptional regulator, Zn(II)-responsive regulator of zntA [Pseudoalteromonas aurantia 208]